MQNMLVKEYYWDDEHKEVDVSRTRNIALNLDKVIFIAYYDSYEKPVNPDALPKDGQWHDIYGEVKKTETVKVYKVYTKQYCFYITQNSATMIANYLNFPLDGLGEWKQD